MMDRSYGVSASELRCEDQNPIQYASKRKADREEKERRALVKIDELISEIVLLSISLKNNPIKNELISANSKSVVIKAIAGLNEKIDKIKVLMITEIDLASDENKKFLKGEEDRVEYLLAVEEFLEHLESNKAVSSLTQYNLLKKLVSVQKVNAIVKKYKKTSRNLDEHTISHLARIGALK